MSYTIELRQDTAANWTSNSPVLAEGELGIETDTLKGKLGNGVTTWTALAYWDPASVAVALAVEVARAEAAEAGLSGAAKLARVAVTGGITHTALAYEVTAVDTTAGNVTVNLPSGAAAGTLNAVKQTVMGTGYSVTVACQGSDVINKTGGGTTQSLTLPSQGSLLHYSGTGGIWTVLSDDLPLSQLQALFAPLASPALTGTPTAPTAAALTATTQVGTTAYTDSAVAAQAAIRLTAEGLLAPKASPALTGTPTAPTAAALTSNTQLASTAYADSATGVEKTRARAAEATAPYVLNVRLGYGGGGSNYSTDDTAAILAAIAAAQSAVAFAGTMPRVYLPYGNWKISSAIPAVPSLTLEGDGPRNTNLKQVTANTDGIQMLGTSGAENSLVTIEGLTVIGTGSGTGCGINMAWAPNCVLRDVSVTGWGSHGLQMVNSWDLNAYNLICADNFGSGVLTDTNTNNCNFTGCLFSANALDGVTFGSAASSADGGANSSFINCDVEANGQNGINFVMAYCCLVMGCDFEANNASGGAYNNVTVQGRAYNGSVTILCNNFTGTGKAQYGVYVCGGVTAATETYNCTIQNNEFGNHVTGDIYVQAGAYNTLLINNNYEPFGGSSTPAPGLTDFGTNTQVLGGPLVSLEPNLPTDYGYLAWNGDPDTGPVSLSLGTLASPSYVAGKAYRARVNVRQTITVGHIAVGWWAGTGMTTPAANVYLALYDSTGVLRGYSANLSGTASGLISVPVTAAAAGLTCAPGFYQVEIVIGTQSLGGTVAAGLMFLAGAVGSFTGAFATMGLTSGSAGVRWTSGATGLSSYEASLAAYGASTNTFWAALAV